MSSSIHAAGTVPWRYTRSGRIKVLLIRRVKHRDWSFPKGKVDRGESLPAAAVRETAEEVGLSLALGATLGTINYLVGDNLRKTVQYWSAEVSPEVYAHYSFSPNSEVKRVRWVALEEVAAKLTYPADREIFEVFERLVAARAHETFALILLRHAKASPRGVEHPVDAARPLRESGVQQAQSIVPVLSAFRPKHITTSSALRCSATVEPLAQELKIEALVTDAISQDTWDEGETRGLRELVARHIDQAETSVLCSHRPVLPDLAREIAAASHSRPGRYLQDAIELPPAAFSVFHISRNPSQLGIVSVESYPIKT